MPSQFDIFGGADDPPPPVPDLPEGFRYQPELVGAADEEMILRHIRELPFREFEFHGYTGKRRVVSFGWQYDFTARQLRKVDDLPKFLFPIREIAAAFFGLMPETFQHVLVTEYGPGAAIGWHRDKAVFGEIVGISLLTACTFRLRRRVGESWERVNVEAQPRSGYLLSGSARSEWEHSIPPVASLRYSITFRNLREDRVPAADMDR